MSHADSLLERVAFDSETGLAPAVVQSDRDGRVLMLAYMNREALRRTLEEGRVTFWSRSRRELWRKGDTSGHWLETVAVRTDCDGDALLVRAVPHGPTCHTGAESCFDAGETARPDGESASRAGGRPRELSDAIEAVLAVVAERDRERPEGSYTADLLAAGPAAPARKVAEEAVEVLVAALEEPERLDEESADLLYHLVVLWRAAGLEAADVGRVLARRRATGGESDPDGEDRA